MMSDEVVIKIENVSKMYKIFDSRSDRLKDTLRFFGPSLAREFWALKNIDLEIVNKGRNLSFTQPGTLK